MAKNGLAMYHMTTRTDDARLRQADTEVKTTSLVMSESYRALKSK